MPILVLVHEAAERSGLPAGDPAIVLGLALTFAVSPLSWRLVERPILKRKDRFEHRADAAPGHPSRPGPGAEGLEGPKPAHSI